MSRSPTAISALLLILLPVAACSSTGPEDDDSGGEGGTAGLGSAAGVGGTNNGGAGSSGSGGSLGSGGAQGKGGAGGTAGASGGAGGSAGGAMGGSAGSGGGGGAAGSAGGGGGGEAGSGGNGGSGAGGGGGSPGSAPTALFPGDPLANLPNLDLPANHTPLAPSDFYFVGSSYNVQDRIVAPWLQAQMPTTEFRRYEVPGSPLRYIWTHVEGQTETEPGTYPLRQRVLDDLQTGKWEAFFINAQRPWILTSDAKWGEAGYATEMGRAAIAANSAVRLSIQEYWQHETEPFCFDAACNSWDNLQMYRLGSLKVIYKMAKALGRKVYAAPVGTVIEHAKRLAIAGELEGFTSRAALHAPDGEHLSRLGQYLQAVTAMSGLFHADPRGTVRKLQRGNTVELDLTQNDANKLQAVIWKAVRGIPFSGWHVNEPATFEAYLQALEHALLNWESFDALQAAAWTSGSYVGDNGIGIDFTNIRRVVNFTLSEAAAEVRQGSTLAFTLPRGVGDLSFSVRNAGAGTAPTAVEVRVDGTKVGNFEVTEALVPRGTRIAGINKAGPVKLELVVTSQAQGPIIDNVRWTDAP